jgi:hypothetical protein
MKESNLGTLFLIKRSSNVDAVDFAILLKNDRIVFLVIKFIANTITPIDMIIRAEAIKPEAVVFRP